VLEQVHVCVSIGTPDVGNERAEAAGFQTALENRRSGGRFARRQPYVFVRCKVETAAGFVRSVAWGRLPGDADMNAMRVASYGLVIAAILLIAPTALAAPFQQFALLSMEQRNVVLAIAIFFGFIAMVLLLPDFDGRTDEDWDMQGQDDLWKH
jgi:hypothetical protein